MYPITGLLPAKLFIGLLGYLALRTRPIMSEKVRCIQEYRAAHPDAEPPEIERYLAEKSRSDTMERWYNRYRGKESTGGLIDVPLYWFWDSKGRARYIHNPLDRRALSNMQFAEWCKSPPLTFWRKS